MTDLYSLPRFNIGWRWALLTKDEQPVGVLDGVKSGRLEFSIYNTVRGGGSFQWAGLAPLDWGQFRVQPWYVADTVAGHIEWPLGVFLMNGPSQQHEDATINVSVDLYDKLLVLDQVKVTSTYTVAAGTVVTTALRTLLAAYPVSITDSTETLSAAMSWPPGTTLLRIGNDLLAAINYFSLWADGYGVFRADKYVAPAYRAVEYEFADTEASIYEPGFVEDYDLFEVPNVVILVARSDGDTPALVGTARNDDPLSPTSTVARGREIAFVEENVEATSVQVLNDLAYRRLLDLSAKATTLQIGHAPIPFDLNDAVTFVNARRAVHGLCVIQSMSMQSAPGSLVQTKLLEVRL